MMKNETRQNIIEYLKINNVFIFPNFKTSICGVINGGIILIILVNKKKKTTKIQKKIVDKITERGGISFVAQSLPEVKFELKDYFL